MSAALVRGSIHVRRVVLACGAMLAAGAIVAGHAASAQDCYYTWERIRDPGGGSCLGVALNNNGVVAGTVSYVGDSTRAFTWSREAGLHVLPLLPGYTSMKARGINDLGQVVGVCDIPSWAGFIWDIQTQAYTIINLPIRSLQIYVNDINNRGEVVGGLLHRYPQQPYFWDPFVWQNGEFTFFGDLIAPRNGWANGINENGGIVGAASDGDWHAFVIEDRHSITWLPPPPGCLQTVGRAINNNGVVVGTAQFPAPVHQEAVIWTSSSIDVFPPAAGQPSALLDCVNDERRSVGAYHGLGGDALAAQYGAAVRLFSLVHPAPPPLSSASAINEAGEIVASYNGGSVVLRPHWRLGDVTGDCRVDLFDLALVLSELGSPVGSFPSADVDHDGRVDLTDLTAVLAHFGE